MFTLPPFQNINFDSSIDGTYQSLHARMDMNSHRHNPLPIVCRGATARCHRWRSKPIEAFRPDAQHPSTPQRCIMRNSFFALFIFDMIDGPELDRPLRISAFQRCRKQVQSGMLMPRNFGHSKSFWELQNCSSVSREGCFECTAAAWLFLGVTGFAVGIFRIRL